MEDISNKTIVTLLVLTLLISLVGTVLVVMKLGSGPEVSLTGAASGSANLTITSVATITLTTDVANFETGSVNETRNGAILDSFNVSNYLYWVPGDNINNGSVIEVRNDGNVRVNITITSNRNGSDFPCNSETIYTDCGVNNGSGDFYFSFVSSNRGINDSSGLGETFSCAGNSCGGTAGILSDETRAGQNVTGFAVNFTDTTAAYVACTNLCPNDGNDEMVIGFSTMIPDDAQGTKTATLTITATALE